MTIGAVSGLRKVRSGKTYGGDGRADKPEHEEYEETDGLAQEGRHEAVVVGAGDDVDTTGACKGDVSGVPLIIRT